MRRASFRLGQALFLLWVFCSTAAAQPRPNFDPRNDYAYDLAATDATAVPVELDATGFRWPVGAAAGDSVFLELAVTAAGGGMPEIKAVRGKAAIRQVFESDTRGRRFLDLSPLCGETDGRVELTGAGASWPPGPARLFCYKNPSLAGRRVLVLAPHPDDAEIAAFGVYRRTGADIVTVTAGDAGGDNFHALFPDRPEHYRIKGWIRTWDSITVPFHGGVPPGQARNLGYYDAVLRSMHAQPAVARPPLIARLDDPGFYRSLNVDARLRTRPFKGTWQALVDDLAWELRRVKPGVIFAPHPLLDNHPDHQFTTIALIEALAMWRGRCELYLYTNHARENEAWPLGDRDAMSGLPPSSVRELFFRRLYSHPVTPQEQKLKLVALEAMHDLRAFDLRDGTSAAQAQREALLHHDYFRRGPRPNELFFVVTREDAFRLREAYLARKSAGKNGAR